MTPEEKRRAAELLRAALEALTEAKELAEFWIEQARPVPSGTTIEPPGSPPERYRLWLALGHQSKSMEKIANALAWLNEVVQPPHQTTKQ